MSIKDKEKWDRRYHCKEYVYGKEPSDFLRQKINILAKGDALVLAMGEGRNAVYLAQCGYTTTGIDISEFAIRKCIKLAKEKDVYVNGMITDLDEDEMGKRKYDLITCFYFFDRSLLPKIISMLKPQGMFILEQFSIENPKQSTYGPRNPDYLIRPNELLETFKLLKILYYEDTIVELNEAWWQGTAAIVRLIAQNCLTENDMKKTELALKWQAKHGRP